MRFLLKDNKSYSLERFDEEKGIIYLKNTTKTTTKEDIKEFLYVADDEKELQESILREKAKEIQEIEIAEEVIEKNIKPKTKKKNG